MMADNQLLNNNGVGGDEVFLYTGGEQEVPRDVKQESTAEWSITKVNTDLAKRGCDTA